MKIKKNNGIKKVVKGQITGVIRAALLLVEMDMPEEADKLLEDWVDFLGDLSGELQDTQHVTMTAKRAKAEHGPVNPATGRREKADKPEQGKVYALMTAGDTPSIANGNSWSESEVSTEDMDEAKNDPSRLDDVEVIETDGDELRRNVEKMAAEAADLEGKGHIVVDRTPPGYGPDC